jgi:hypothetical protein
MPIAKTLDGTKLQNCRNHIKAKGTRYINHKHWNKIKKGNESSLIHLEPQRASHYKKFQENLKNPKADPQGLTTKTKNNHKGSLVP